MKKRIILISFVFPCFLFFSFVSLGWRNIECSKIFAEKINFAQQSKDKEIKEEPQEKKPVIEFPAKPKIEKKKDKEIPKKDSPTKPGTKDKEKIKPKKGNEDEEEPSLKPSKC